MAIPHYVPGPPNPKATRAMLRQALARAEENRRGNDVDGRVGDGYDECLHRKRQADVMSALDANCPAARVYPESRQAASRHADEVRIAFDGDAVLFSDYGKGGLAHIAEMIKSARRARKRVLVDPKGSDFSRYRGAFVLKPKKPASLRPVDKVSSDKLPSDTVPSAVTSSSEIR